MLTATAPLDRFRLKVDPAGELQVPARHATHFGPCDLWTASTDEGYGTFWVDGSRVYAHHWLWVTTHGPPPAGLVPDHRCHSYLWCAGGPACPHRRCVNLRHMQLVTVRENNRRGCGAAGINSRKAVCDAGHALAGANVYIHPRRGTRHCRTCQALRNAAHYAAAARRTAGPGQLALAI